MTSVVVPGCCRCCLAEDEPDMVYVFDILDEFDSKICDLIESCGGIEITEGDCHSKNICGNCLNDLANAARFRDRCAKTEQFLANTSVCEQDDVVFEQAEEELDTSSLVKLEEEEEGDDVIEYSDEDRDSRIQFIIAEDPNDPELAQFDYDQLISSQGSDVEDAASAEVKARNEFMEKVVHPRPLQLNFVCQECGAGFALQKNLAKHMASHRSFVCEVCLMPFEGEADLQAHTAQGHPEVTEEASDCSKVEGQKPAKRNHKCEFCGKAFVSNSALTAHVRIHTKERPFPCSYCTKRFRTAGAQELHERRHNGIKPYSCDVCGRGFAESSNLKVHRLTHTKEKPHVCTVCNRAFARVFLLKIHQRTHTGERPYACHCGKSFAQQGDLAAHQRIHSGERPHTCPYCQRGFIKSSGLAQHIRKQHKRPLMDAGDEFIVGDYESFETKDCDGSAEEEAFETIIVKG